MPSKPLDLTPSEKRRVEELLAALRTNVDVAILPDSWLLDDRFVEEFQSRLLAQHSFMGSVLAQLSFEAAFEASASAAGRSVAPAPSGQRFWDLQVDGNRISLKSTKAKSLKEKTLHISKLTEAAWIQDCRTARARKQHVQKLFRDYTETVDSIFQLRYFANLRKYELVEIPVQMLAGVFDVPLSHFNADGPSINIPVGQNPPDFTLKLDRSDAKITLANILKEKCTVHGSWTFPKP